MDLLVQDTFAFHGATELHEAIGWLPKPVAIICARDLDRIRAITARVEPVIGTHYVPAGVQLVCGSPEHGTPEWIPSAAMSHCDRVAKRLLAKVRSSEVREPYQSSWNALCSFPTYRSGRLWDNSTVGEHMALGNRPTMFVSSTCYDLAQLRADIKDFLEELGIQPILSEYDSFPVDPDKKAVENCLRVVEENADLFLLVVGHKYGSIQQTGKSITNMEYLRARAKGLPIYIFVEKDTIAMMPIWRDNPTANYDSVTDSSKIFEFVESLRSVEGAWVFPFENAQDIIDTLRLQLAYLFADALELRLRLKLNVLSPLLASLHGVPLKLVIDRSMMWEHRLLAHLMVQEIEKVNSQRLDMRYGIAFGRSEFLSDLADIFRWLRQKMGEAMKMVEAANQLLNTALPEALGEPGVAGTAESIVYVARRYANVYQEAIEWSLEARRVLVADEEFEEIVRITGLLLEESMTTMEEFSNELFERTETALITLQEDPEASVTIDMKLTFKVSNIDDFNNELGRLASLYE